MALRTCASRTLSSATVERGEKEGERPRRWSRRSLPPPTAPGGIARWWRPLASYQLVVWVIVLVLQCLGLVSRRRRSPAAPASWWNKSFWTLPRLIGAPLRHRRRVHGRGVSLVDPLYRSSSAAGSSRRSVVASLLLGGCGESYGLCGSEVGSLSCLPWRQRHQRGWIQGQGAWGVSPADGCSMTASAHPSGRVSSAAFSKAFVRWSSLWPGVQQRPDLVFPTGRWGFLKLPVNKGSRDLFAFFIFLEALCAKRMGHMYSVSFYGVLVTLWVLGPVWFRRAKF